MKIPRDFSARPEREQRWLTDDTWCDVCNEADLGMREPKEFEENGKMVVEGLCRKCGSSVRTYVEVTQSNPPRTNEEKPNKAPEPTITAVTIRAPSSTARASCDRGSSLTLGKMPLDSHAAAS